MISQARAETRARALHALLTEHLHTTQEREQISELAAAAVSPARIQVLYPGSLLDLAPRLEARIWQTPILSDAKQLDEALLQLRARQWAYFTLHPRHAQQLFQVAFQPGRQRAPAPESVNLRATLALIVILEGRAFEAVGKEVPWAKISDFLAVAQHPLQLAATVLTQQP